MLCALTIFASLHILHYRAFKEPTGFQNLITVFENTDYTIIV